MSMLNKIPVEVLYNALRANTVLRYDVERKGHIDISRDVNKKGRITSVEFPTKASPDTRYQVMEVELLGNHGDSEIARALMMRLMQLAGYSNGDIQLELCVGRDGFNKVREYLTERLYDLNAKTRATRKFNIKMQLIENYLIHNHGKRSNQWR